MVTFTASYQYQSPRRSNRLTDTNDDPGEAEDISCENEGVDTFGIVGIVVPVEVP